MVFCNRYFNRHTFPYSLTWPSLHWLQPLSCKICHWINMEHVATTISYWLNTVEQLIKCIRHRKLWRYLFLNHYCRRSHFCLTVSTVERHHSDNPLIFSCTASLNSWIFPVQPQHLLSILLYSKCSLLMFLFHIKQFWPIFYWYPLCFNFDKSLFFKL